MERILIAPIPYKDESMGGYLLRLSSENHYENIKWLYDSLDLSNYFNKNVAFLNIKETNLINLLKETGIGEVQLERLSFQSELDFIKETIAPSQYIKLHRHGINSRFAKICPLCFNEHSYHKKIWEISINHTCLTHNCFLVDRCPICQKEDFYIS